jgi:hypothetical protein
MANLINPSNNYLLKITVFLDVILCSLGKIYCSFGGTYCPVSSALKMAAVCSSKTASNFYETEQLHSPEHVNYHSL